MVENIRLKIRSLCEDNKKSGFETFVYTSSNIFTIAQSNIVILKVLLDGIETNDYEFDEDTNKIEFTVSGSYSVIEVDYTYTKYSDTELNDYIRASLVWISVYCYDNMDYEFEEASGGEDYIAPTPENRTTDLIALIASIIIKPDWSVYKLPNVTVQYPRNMPKEERIERLIGKFNMGLGISGIIQFDIYNY